MQVWQKYFFKRWLKSMAIMSALGIVSLIYMALRKENIDIAQIESIWIGISTVLCFSIGVRQVSFDYPLALQVKAKRQCYLKYMGAGVLIGGLALFVIEKLFFGILEGGGVEKLVWQQCLYRYSTLVMMALFGSFVASMFYRLTAMIVICLIGSFVAIGVASFTWGMISQNAVIAIICNFYIIGLRSLTSVGGMLLASVIFAAATYALLYKAPIKAYKCDLL